MRTGAQVSVLPRGPKVQGGHCKVGVCEGLPSQTSFLTDLRVFLGSLRRVPVRPGAQVSVLPRGPKNRRRNGASETSEFELSRGFAYCRRPPNRDGPTEQSPTEEFPELRNSSFSDFRQNRRKTNFPRGFLKNPSVESVPGEHTQLFTEGFPVI